MSRSPTDRDDFPLAIICAKKIEYDAVSLLVEWWYTFEDRTAAGGTNMYKYGRIGKVNVAMVLLHQRGKAAAAAAAERLKTSSSKPKLILLVGICGGVPSAVLEDEMLLGDVIVSESIVEYDFGKQGPTTFKMSVRYSDMTEAAKSVLRTLKTNRFRLQNKARDFLSQLQQKALFTGQQAKYNYPGATEDRLFNPAYVHRHQSSVPPVCPECCISLGSPCEPSGQLSCDKLGCSDDYVMQRSRLEQGKTCRVFFGRFASADRVMKSGEHRDSTANPHGAMAFEMEGSYVLGQYPCIIVKGVSDYADSHKNDVWQGYAAATAASAVRALVEEISDYLLADVQGHPKRRAHRASATSKSTNRFKRERSRIRCYRCDHDHSVRDCRAREDTVWRAREKRGREDRCYNCGCDDHWVDGCGEPDFLRRRIWQ